MRPDGNGKGDKPRPFSVTQDEFAENWDNIFKKKEKNDYQDVLSTEDCVLDALDELKKD